jgi:anti-sigma regulatory factor (Ser/Thr protein kinase)
VSTDDEQQVSPAFPQRLSGHDAYSVARGTWPLEAVRSNRVELSGTLDAGTDARRALELHLGSILDDFRLRDIRLLVTELVTNAVLHGEGKSGVVMYVAASASCVRVEVCDGGSGFAFSREPRSADTLGGLGLRIVDNTASRWGIAGDDGTCVWFEIDLG